MSLLMLWYTLTSRSCLSVRDRSDSGVSPLIRDCSEYAIGLQNIPKSCMLWFSFSSGPLSDSQTDGTCDTLTKGLRA